MRFYLLALIIAFFQSSVLLALFLNLLTVPNLLLAYLYINLIKEEDHSLKKPLISGLFLDLFQDSLRLLISGYTFFSIGLYHLYKLFRAYILMVKDLRNWFSFCGCGGEGKLNEGYRGSFYKLGL